jgi:putative oxygen-independent coproporphyrinogen III oxidase
MEIYAEAVIREMQLQKDYLTGAPLETIYFGGGTPSLLVAEDIARMIAAAGKIFPVTEHMEITLEANPENISTSYIAQLLDAGINRISIGVQSFHDDDLKYLSRIHTAAAALAAVEMLIDSRSPEITADLIYGIPSLTDEQWEKNLEMLTQRGTPHISAYALTVEERTPLHHYIKKGSLLLPDETQAVRQYEILMDHLEGRGYEHYEISNFCLPGHHSRHNSAYWQGIPYLGLGPSAHSYNGESRQWNANNLAEYLSALNRNELTCEIEMLTETDRYNEFIMTGMRTSAGVDLKKLTAVFGDIRTAGFLSSVEIFIQRGWVEKSDENFRLTRKGKLFADRVAGELFVVRR